MYSARKMVVDQSTYRYHKFTSTALRSWTRAVSPNRRPTCRWYTPADDWLLFAPDVCPREFAADVVGVRDGGMTLDRTVLGLIGQITGTQTAHKSLTNKLLEIVLG
jgi:hypothetical protein